MANKNVQQRTLPCRFLDHFFSINYENTQLRDVPCKSLSESSFMAKLVVRMPFLCLPSQLSINYPQHCSAVTWNWTTFGQHLKGFLVKGSRFLRRVGSIPPLRWVKQRHVRHKRPYFILDGMIKLTKNCWQPLRQGLRRRQRGRAVRASDSRSSGLGF